MTIEIDHVFVACHTDAPEGGLLVNQGFLEGSPNRHPGQGTANRRFFFDNFMLELIWIDNEKEARSELTKDTRLWERCNKRDANSSPFGLVFRPKDSNELTPPFSTWKYCPQYLPPELAIEIAAGTSLTEPGIFYLPFLNNRNKGANEPTNHALPFRNVKRIELGLPNAMTLTSEFRNAIDSGGIECFQSVEHVIHIVFEGESAMQLDFRPQLPVILMTE